MKKRLLVATILAVFSLTSVSVMAAESPTADDYYNITVGDETLGTDSSSTVKVPGGTVDSSTGAVVVGDEVTFTANPDDGNSFSKWIIDGEYVIVDGAIDEDTITIVPSSDIVINAEFLDEDGNVIGDDDGDVDPGQTSPQTGTAAGGLFVALLASGAVAATSKKKLSK